MKPLQTIAALTAAMHMTACATAIRGTKEDMVVQTDPGGARVTTTLETPQSIRARKKDSSLAPVYYGCPATPCEIEMPRKAYFLLTIEKEGYEPVTIAVQGKLGKSGMTANLATAGGAAGLGAAVGASAASLGSAFGTAGAAGAGAGVGAVTAGIFLVPLGIDAASGAMLNHNPNPVYITLPPEGTVFEADPGVAIVEEKLREKERAAAYRAALRACQRRKGTNSSACLSKSLEELKVMASAAE